MLGGLAECEREAITARTGEGRRRAVAAGVKLGRKFKLTPYQMAEVILRQAEGEWLHALTKCYGVTHTTIMRALERQETQH